MSILTFAHPKGGVGKSTNCFNYCIYKQSENQDFIVADLDGQHTMSVLNGIRVQQGLPSLNIKQFDNTEDLIKFFNENMNKDIVVDSGGFDSAYNRIAVAFSDLVIVPTSESPVEQMRIFDFSNILKDIMKEVKRDINSYILLNRVNHAYSDKTLSGIKASFSYEPYKFLDTVIRDRVEFKFSLATGRNVVESNNDTKASQEIVSLYEEIRSIL